MANPFLRCIVLGPSYPPPVQPGKLQELRNIFFTADNPSQKLLSPHFLWPLSSLLSLPVFVLFWSDTPSMVLCLPFSPLLVTFQSPLPRVAPACYHSCTLSFSLFPGRPAVFLRCMTLGKFLNLSEPVSAVVKFFFHLPSTLLHACPALDTGTRRMSGGRSCLGTPT